MRGVWRKEERDHDKKDKKPHREMWGRRRILTPRVSKRISYRYESLLVSNRIQ